MRSLLAAAEHDLASELRSLVSSGDDYASSTKPQIDWQDAEAREALIDSRAQDAFSCLGLLDGRWLSPGVGEAVKLLATVVGQDLDTGEDGRLRNPHRDRRSDHVEEEARR